ncbi:hypothetical protein [Victivallis vadensis]|uniref:hypothetical protein n=1 Tax=Victivallis vadensis TaxID=172901 RepID=UPI00266CC375|nr:hypothetical protein [Victivallis vadensis]
MANETTIKIKLNADGKSYTAEIVEADAKNGTRLDQRVAQTIIHMDERLRDPQTLQMIQNARQNPQAMLQQMMGGMMGGGGMNPMQMMGGMFGGR